MCIRDSYYLVLAFNLAVTAVVAEPALFWDGVAAHLPLAWVVVSCVASSSPTTLTAPRSENNSTYRRGEPRAPASRREPEGSGA